MIKGNGINELTMEECGSNGKDYNMYFVTTKSEEYAKF